tara:strand:+ start:2699 stop:3220 length:522 start_codon:yes stop_codon:yes gene_type:complete
MKDILFIISLTLGMGLILLMQLDYENQINDMQNDIDNYEFAIDSLLKEVDTLNYEIEIWDDFPSSSTISALIFVESSYNDSAYNSSEDAVGCLQIRKTMVNDINRILKNNFYSYEDRWDRDKSIEMLKIYCNHYNFTTPEQIARCWNGGPKGLEKPQTANYWSKVESQIKENS